METKPLETGRSLARRSSNSLFETTTKFKRSGGRVVRVFTKRDSSWYDGLLSSGPIHEIFAEPTPVK